MPNLNSLLGKLPAPIAGALKAVVGAILPLVSVSLLNGSLDYRGLVAAGLTALAVYFAPNVVSGSKPVSAPKPATPSK